MKEISEQFELNFMFGDWVIIGNDSHSVIGYLGNNGFSLQIIERKKQLKSFGFFEIVSSEAQISQVLKHVQSGLYLSSFHAEANGEGYFDHLTLKTVKQQSCLFMFQKQSKRVQTNTQKNIQTSQESAEIDILNIENEAVKIGCQVRILNCLSCKYLQVVKTQSTLDLKERGQYGMGEKPWMSQVQSEGSKLKGKQRASNVFKFNERQSIIVGKERQSVSITKHQSLEPAQNNIWLSSNFDVFTLKLERRSRFYNPVLLSNYDVVLIYNKFTHSYVTVSKKRQLLNLNNFNRYSQQQNPSQKTKSIVEDKTPPFPIQLNSNYFSSKNCFVQQTPDHMFQNKNTLSYLWKVFSNSIDETQQLNTTINYPSLIRSKSFICFQHLQTGLFLIKNQNQNQSSDEYILRESFQQPDDDQNSQKNIFMFRIQNLAPLRYEKRLILKEQVRDLRKERINCNFINTEFQPVNSSLHVTLDFEEQEFMISKIQSYPRIYYFCYHFPQFIKQLISFLNNPKAIDDRISLLKQKLIIMEIIYENVFSQDFSQIAKQIDRGFYFLSKTITVLKIIRMKIKHYELEASKIKINLQNTQQSKKYQTTQNNQGKNKDFDFYAEHYIFSSTQQPFEQLQELNSIIFTLLKPLIVKILKFLSLVFGTQSKEIFDMMKEKELVEQGSVHDIKRTSQGFNVENSPNQQTIIKKKNSTIMSSSLAKKRVRNNSSSSYKSNSSSISGDGLLGKEQNVNLKSAFANRQGQNERKESNSQIITELIKSLIYLFQIQPRGCSQILKLLSVQQPYEIIEQLNQKLETLESKVTQLQETGTRSKHSGYESNPNLSNATTLKAYKQLENAIFQQMLNCLKLINHILQYFNGDLDYDWAKKLRYIESNFQVKLIINKDTKIQSRHQTKKDAQIAIHYRKRWFKLSQILSKTQNSNFKKLLKLVKEKNKKFFLQHNKHEHSNQNKKKKQKSQNQIYKNKRASTTSLMKQSEKLIQKQLSDKSNSEKYLFQNGKQKEEKKSKEQIEDNLQFHGGNGDNEKENLKDRKKLVLVNEERNNFFQFLKDTLKLMLINLKSTNMPMSEMLYFFDCGKVQDNEQSNSLYQYSNLSSLGYVLEFVNNIDITLIKGLASFENLGNFDISLLNNCRFISCDNEPISEKKDLFKILNFQSYSLEGNQNQMNLHDYPLFLRQENIRYLIERSPFCAEFYEQIFDLLIENPEQQSSRILSQKRLFIEGVSGLKTFFISLYIFVSVGHWSFRTFKKIENYTLRLCRMISKYINKSKGNKRNNEQHWRESTTKCNQSDTKYNEKVVNFQDQIISGVKDGIQSLLIEINQLMEIIYIQKKRVIRYPHIIDSLNFFSASQLSAKYQQLMQSSLYLVKEIPILTHLFQLTSSLSSFTSIYSQYAFSEKENKKNLKILTEHRVPNFSFCQISSSSMENLEQKSGFMIWPYLYFEEIQIFYPHEIQIESIAFRRTLQIMTKLNELSLMLNTLESLEQSQKVKNHLVVEIRQKILSISTSLLSLPKIQANKKVISSFGLIEIILTIILNNKILQKVSIKPFLQFLIEIKMWAVTAKDFYRVLVKGGLSNNFSVNNSDKEAPSYESSFAFLLKNIKKPQFFVIVAKYLEQTQSQSDKHLIAQTLTYNLIQLIDYNQNQPYNLLVQKLTFANLIIQKTQNQKINLKFFHKLMNRQDVQLYMEALRTLKNFQTFSQNIKNINQFLENKKHLNEKYYIQNFSNQNFTENRNTKNISVFNLGTNLRSQTKLKKIIPDIGSEKDEMTTFKKQEITKFTILTSMIFKIYNRIKSLIGPYFDNYISEREILKIVRSNVSAFGGSYQMLKPLLIYFESNQLVFESKIRRSFSFTLSFSHINLAQTIGRQNQISGYLEGVNDILCHYSLCGDELESYQATSSFFLPFFDQDDGDGNQVPMEFNKEKVKKISSELKNFNKKTYFWELLLWNPCYQQEQGVLVLIEKIILGNLDLFVWKTQGKKRNQHKRYTQDILEKLQSPLSIILHSVFENILNIYSMIENLTSSRFVRLQTRLHKLKMIFIEIFPTIQSSLINLKSLRLKEKQEQSDGHVIEEEDEESLGFMSSEDKNMRSQIFGYDRKESFSSLTRKIKNIKITKRIMNEPKTLEVKRGMIINKKKDNGGNEKFNAEMIGYHLVTKLWSNQKIQKFIKVFEEEEKRRQFQLQQLSNNGKQFQMQQINLIGKSHPIFAEIEDYLEDESEDYVIDEPTYKKKQGKSQVPKKLHFRQSQQSNEMLELKHKISKSQLSEMHSLTDSANYSHHAMIIAENSLNQDTPARKLQTLNEEGHISSKCQNNQHPKGPKDFLTNAGFESLNTIKNLRRADYSNIYKRMKTYKFYEVIMLLKKVLFLSPKTITSTPCQPMLQHSEYENELYYQLEKLFLDFFTLKANMSSFFQNMQNYLKLQSQKAAEKQFDVNFCFEISGVRRHYDEGRINDRILVSTQDKKNEKCNQQIKDNYLDCKILLSFCNKQNYSTIEHLVNVYLHSHQFTFPNQSIENINNYLQLLHWLMQSNNKEMREFQFHQKFKQNTKEVNENSSFLMNKKTSNRQSQNWELRSEDKSLKSIQKHHFPSQSFIPKSKLIIPNTHQNTHQKSLNSDQFQQFLRETQSFLVSKKSKVSIICGLLKIFNSKVQLLKQKNQLQTVTLSFSLLNFVQQSLQKFIFKLIWSFRLLENSLKIQPFLRTKNKSNSAIISVIESEKFEIKFKLLQFLDGIINFMSFSKEKVEKSELKRSMENVVGKLIEFSLEQSYQQIEIAPKMIKESFQNSISNYKQIKDISKLKMSLSSIQMAKQYFETMSGLVKNDGIQRELYEQAASQFSYKMIVGSIDKVIASDLTSSNLESLELISLMTSCLTFLQIFVSSTSSANILKNNSTKETILIYTELNNRQIQNGWLPFQLALKLIHFEIFIYDFLFKNQSQYFSSSHNHYLKQMMSFNSINQNPSTQQFDHQKDKTSKYLKLLHLLIESLNIFHNLFYKFCSFPRYENNIFQQRKLFFQHDQNLNNDMERLKNMYSHLDEIFRTVIISPSKQRGRNKVQVVTFPFYRQFQFVWKFSLLKLSQSFLNQNQRMDIVFGASKVFLSQNFTLRKITYYIVKWAPLCSIMSQIVIAFLILNNLLIGGHPWIMVINYIFLTLNFALIMFTTIERLTSTVIMASVIALNRKTNLVNAIIILVFVYTPLLFSIVANFYSYWETRAIPFILFICLFNRLEKFYAICHQNFKLIKSMFVFLLGFFMTIFAFHFFTKLGLNIGLPVNQDYFSIQKGIFKIDGKSFNFLNMIFEFPAQIYITNPVTIIFYIWFCSIEILAIALIIISICERIKTNNLIDPETGKNYECSLCSKKAEFLLQQYVKEKESIQKISQIKKESFLQKRLKSYVFDRNKKYSRFIGENLSEMEQFQKEETMKEIILSHIKQRHNLFEYISYFCYILDKKESFLSEKQKMIKRKIEENDSRVYF